MEAGDRETRAALAARPPRAGVEVIALAPGQPQTKPRALNAGLLAARGEFIVVFDAEDRPEPDQLRHAVEAFRRGPKKLACVQARLAIDNLRDGWLVRHFAIEYAALFDVVLPALAGFGLPIPLGGTSNHFRTGALRAVGGWDAGNVTEDADLGLRLARLGWSTGVIASTTFEEAPIAPVQWIKQRTRWMKGYMVTAVLHGRSLPDLARRLDPLSLVASQLLIGGVAVTALAYPFAVIVFVWSALTGSLFAPAGGITCAALACLHITNLIVGFSSGLACALAGIDRRPALARFAGDIATIPAYWFLVGIAAWRALLQIALGQTAHWEKTAHGLSKTRAAPPQM